MGGPNGSLEFKLVDFEGFLSTDVNENKEPTPRGEIYVQWVEKGS